MWHSSGILGQTWWTNDCPREALLSAVEISPMNKTTALAVLSTLPVGIQVHGLAGGHVHGEGGCGVQAQKFLMQVGDFVTIECGR